MSEPEDYSGEEDEDGGLVTVNPIGEYYGDRNHRNERHGRARTVLPNGDLYLGTYDRGYRHGMGAYLYKGGKGARYGGDWVLGKKHGWGTMYFPDGSQYTGNWHRGHIHGWGLYAYSNGDEYEGWFYMGAKHGRGIYRRKKRFAGGGAACDGGAGEKFVGTWHLGVKHGPGQIITDEYRYIGSWDKDVPRGKGTFVFEEHGMEQQGQFLIKKLTPEQVEDYKRLGFEVTNRLTTDLPEDPAMAEAKAMFEFNARPFQGENANVEFAGEGGEYIKGKVGGGLNPSEDWSEKFDEADGCGGEKKPERKKTILMTPELEMEVELANKMKAYVDEAKEKIAKAEMAPVALIWQRKKLTQLVTQIPDDTVPAPLMPPTPTPYLRPEDDVCSDEEEEEELDELRRALLDAKYHKLGDVYLGSGVCQLPLSKIRWPDDFVPPRSFSTLNVSNIEEFKSVIESLEPQLKPLDIDALIAENEALFKIHFFDIDPKWRECLGDNPDCVQPDGTSQQEGGADMVPDIMIVMEEVTPGSTPLNSSRRKSLSDRTIQSESFKKLAEKMKFAREPMVTVAPRHSGTKANGDVFVFGNHTTGEDDDEKIDDFQRAVRCLKSEYKTFAAEHFDQLLMKNESRALAEVWPLLEKALKASALLVGEKPSQAEPIYEFHDAASRKFPFSIAHLYRTGNIDAARKLTALLFELIICQDKEISMYWGECLEKVVIACNTPDVRRDIYPKIVALAKGGDTVSSNGKVGALHALHKLARRFDAEFIENDILPIFNSLSKDPSPEVRAVAASCLAELIQRSQHKDDVIKLINGIKGDIDPRVRAALTSTILKSVTLVNPAEKENKAYLERVMQTIKELVKDAYWKENIDVLVAYTEYIGSVCEAFTSAGIMKEGDVLWFLDAFLQLSKYGTKSDNLKRPAEMPAGFSDYRDKLEFLQNRSIQDGLMSSKPPKMAEKPTSNKPNARAHECRKNTAKQFYAFMMFANPVVGFKNGLHPLVSDLTHDAHPEVRAAMAEKLLPIMGHLGEESGVLQSEVVATLKDDDLDVIQAVVPNLAGILKSLVKAKVVTPDKATPKLSEIGGALLDLEERLNQTTYYKVHKDMLEQMAILPQCFPGDYVFENVFPALLSRLKHKSEHTSRMAAANSMVAYLRHSGNSAQRKEMQAQIKKAFAQGSSVHDRILFLDMAKKIMEIFPKKYVKDNIMDEVLLLSNDPVGNVRMKVMDLLPELQQDPSQKGDQDDEGASAPKPADAKKPEGPKKPAGESPKDQNLEGIQKEIEERLLKNIEEKTAKKKAGRSNYYIAKP